MAINSTGAISLGGSVTGESIALELGLSATSQISMNDAVVRTLLGLASGDIGFNSAYGKSSALAFGISSGGYNGTNQGQSKYTYASDAWTAGTALVSGARTASVSTASGTIMYINGGSLTGGNFQNPIASTEKYVFSSDAVTNFATATPSSRGLGHGMTNISTVGIFTGGTGGATYNSTSSKLTYSNDTYVAGGTLAYIIYTSSCGTGFGTTLIGYRASGIIQAGTAIMPVDKYTFSADTSAAGTSLTASVRGASINSGTPLVGVTLGGFNESTVHYNSVFKYTFSNDTVASGTNLGTTRSSGAALCSKTTGYGAGGYAASVLTAVTSSYVFSSDVTATVTALPTTRYRSSGHGAAPNGIG
jgi:hypothetical protein